MSRRPRAIRHPGLAARFGVARADITAPVGIYNRSWGAATHDCAEGVHMPLTATALAILADGEAPLAMLALDLGWISRREDDAFLRGYLLRGAGHAGGAAALLLSHTHAGPSTDRSDADRPGGRLIAPYLELVRARSLARIRAAIAGARPGSLSWGYGSCALATNRDLPDPDRDRRIAGYNPDIAADHAVLVGRATADDGAAIATIVNYACHPTTLAWANRLLSPDYVGAMRETVECATGAPCLFLQGPSGDLAPREQYSGDTAVADRNGRHLGHAALATLADMVPPSCELRYSGVIESGTPLANWQTARVELPRGVAVERIALDLERKPQLTEAQFRARLGAINAAQTADPERVLRERMERAAKVAALLSDGPTTRQPFFLWRLGGACWWRRRSRASARCRSPCAPRLAPATRTPPWRWSGSPMAPPWATCHAPRTTTSTSTRSGRRPSRAAASSAGRQRLRRGAGAHGGRPQRRGHGLSRRRAGRRRSRDAREAARPRWRPAGSAACGIRSLAPLRHPRASAANRGVAPPAVARAYLNVPFPLKAWWYCARARSRSSGSRTWAHRPRKAYATFGAWP